MFVRLPTLTVCFRICHSTLINNVNINCFCIVVFCSPVREHTVLRVESASDVLEELLLAEELADGRLSEEDDSGKFDSSIS